MVSPGAGVYRIKDSHLSLLGRPPGEVQRIDGVCLGVLGVIFRCLDIKLVAFAADAVLQVPQLRLGSAAPATPAPSIAMLRLRRPARPAATAAPTLR